MKVLGQAIVMWVLLIGYGSAIEGWTHSELKVFNCLVKYINEGMPWSLYVPWRSRIEYGGRGIGSRLLPHALAAKMMA